jgi:phage terminase large subunit
VENAKRRTIELDYCPRIQFAPFHDRTQRWACLVAHRRAGKTVATINDKIKRAVTDAKPDGRYAYIAPLYNQAKDIAWAYLKQYAYPILSAPPNESELRVDLINGARIRLYGADNPDRLRGLYLDGVTLDEFGDMKPSIWTDVIRPALSDRKGWATFIGTPKGKNAFYEIMHGSEGWTGAVNDPEWYALTLKASETALIDAAELADARKQMGEDQYAQEYECSFEAAIKGAFYADELRRAEADNRIGRVPIDRGLPVHTAWDLGVTDSTAIWFIQCLGKERRLIDYYETSGVGLDHYAAVLKERGYVYGQHYLPHDIANKELSTGKSRVDTLKALGITPEVVPVSAVMDGINAVRRMIDQCWIDKERCARGLEALKQYRRDYDETLKDWKTKPLHDWTSHGADALRTFACGYEDRTALKMLNVAPRGRGAWMGG